MAKVHITQEFLKQVKLPSKKSKEVYYDIELKGFILETRTTGTQTFYYQSSVNGKRKMTKIATTLELSVEQAKQKAIEIKKQKYQESQTTQDEPNQITFQEFYDKYYLPYIKNNIKSYESNISMFKNHIIPHLSNTKMIDLKTTDVMSMHSNMCNIKKLSQATANKFLVFLSSSYRLSHTLEILPDTINPCKGVKEYKLNNQRQIFLNKSQTKALLQQVELSKNEHLQYIIPMLLLTGARKREVLDSQWSDFDMLNKLWTIPISKSGKKHILPITPPLEKLLNQIPKQSKYLFASPRTKKPYVSFYHSWNRARIKANLPEVRIHDLRHTYASQLVASNCSLYTVQKLLNHSDSKMTQRYAHLSNDALMQAASHAGKLLK